MDRSPHPIPTIDGTVALLLCLAINVESIRLTAPRWAEYLDITRKVLNSPWSNMPGSPVPFSKLKSVELHGSLEQDAGMKLSVNGATPRLVIKSVCIQAINNAPYVPDTLRFLELHSVLITPDLVESLVAGLTYLNLKSLALYHLGSDEAEWADYDYSRLSALLVTHTPHLESFECMHLYPESPRPFTHLRRLTKLHTLRVDAELLIDFALENVYICGTAMLPAGLKHLELGVSDPKHIEHHIEGPTEEGPDSLFADPIRSVALETFTVTVTMRPYYYMGAFQDATCDRMKEFVERVAQRGLEYRVFG